MKKLLQSNWQLLVVIALSIFVIWPLFVPGYFSHHDDLQVMRIYEMRKCLSDFQIPCRWVPDMGYGNGYPLFNFYGPFAYYIGGIFSYVLGYIASAKLLFFLPLVLGGVGMYLLARELFGKYAGLVAGVLYLFAPYRALDSFVRGAVGESFALSVIPFVLYFYLRLIKQKNRSDFIWATILTAILFMSHNIMTLLFSPLIVIWNAFWLYRYNWKSLKLTLFSLVISFGLAAFFLMPAFIEKELVQTESLTRAELDFRAQFVKVSQLFIDRSWNYSGSTPLSGDTISYQIGWPLWLIAFLGVIFSFALKAKNKLLGTLLFILFGLGIFMTHNKSAFIWENIKILSFVQFPWRFLSIVIVFGSLLGGYFISLFKERITKILSILIVVLTVFLNWQYFKPEHFYKDITDETKLSGQSFIDQQKGSLLDYLPKTALEPRELAPKEPLITRGEAKVTNFVNRSKSWSFEADVTEEAIIEIPVFDFPNWTVYVNKERYEHSNKNITGRIMISLPTGKYNVNGKFLTTPIRRVGNIVSVLSFLTLATIIIYGKNKKLFSK